MRYDASLLARKHATAATSAGSPSRRIGVRPRTLRRDASSPSTAFFASSVAIVPGPIAFTRMPCGASASAITFVSCAMPPLLTTYGTWFGIARIALTLDMWMIAPRSTPSASGVATM